MTTYAVVGGGLVGLAIAHKLLEKNAQFKVLLFEKEEQVGLHQSTHNSGVLHCGLHYKPGSLKAKLAVQGVEEMTNFCIKHHVNHDVCGEIVVATDPSESAALQELHRRGNANGLKGLKMLTKAEAKAREPYANVYEALLVPQEGIADYKGVTLKLRELIESKGGEVICNTKIDRLTNHQNKVVLSDGNNEWEADYVITCTGLFADRTYQDLTKKKSPIKIVPFRGEYLELTEDATHLFNHLIYPVPNAKFPFLGVHFTRMINGSKEVGPNAVLATKREGYSNKDFSLADTWDAITYKGMLKFLAQNFSFSMKEFATSFSDAAFIKKAQKLVPEIQAHHLKRGNAGVRAQAVGADGQLLMDFEVVREGNQIHVLNAPSPAATASLAIAGHVLENYVFA